MNDVTVILFEETSKDIKILIQARITENRELMVEGVDSGEAVERLKGDWDYEYYLTLSESNKELLKEKVGVDMANDLELLHWIKENYSGNRAFSSFRSFLTAEQIEYKTFNWI